MRKLGYLQVSYKILKRNFYELAQSNGMEEHSEQSRKPLSQQWILKKAERHIYHCCVVSDRQTNLLKRFLLVTLPYMNDMISISHERFSVNISAYTQRTTKLFTPIIKSLLP